MVDDASHRYVETKTTFETIFPFLRRGGAYIIEDWEWGHAIQWPQDQWIDRPLMSPLLSELMLVCGHQSGVIARFEIDPAFAVVWRGDAPLPKDGSFKLSDHYIARGFSVPL